MHQSPQVYSQKMLWSGVLTCLRVEFLQVKTPALRTVGNIVTGDDNQTQLVINCSVLPCLLSLLSR